MRRTTFFACGQLSTGTIVRPDHTADVPASMAKLKDYLKLVRNKEARESPHSILQNFQLPLNPTQTIRVRIDNSSLYSPVPYLPQTVGVLISRKLGWPPVAMLYLGRLACAIAYALLGWLAIRITPVLKWPMVVALLAPMSVFMAASVSAE